MGDVDECNLNRLIQGRMPQALRIKEIETLKVNQGGKGNLKWEDHVAIPASRQNKGPGVEIWGEEHWMCQPNGEGISEPKAISMSEGLRGEVTFTHKAGTGEYRASAHSRWTGKNSPLWKSISILAFGYLFH